MLCRITKYEDLDTRQLMDLYAEGNMENADDLYPGVENRSEAVKMTEADFLSFLKNDFFTRAENTYWVYEENGVWVSALRTSRIREDLYYLEALETRPAFRKRGYATRLLNGVISALKADGPFRLCDCVGKRNTASLLTHAACGFSIVSEAGYNYLCGESNDRTFGMEYRYSIK